MRHAGRARAGVERTFAVQKDQMGLFIRTIGLDRARTKIRPRQPGLQPEAVRLVRTASGDGLRASTPPMRRQKARSTEWTEVRPQHTPAIHCAPHRDILRFLEVFGW